MRTPSPLRHIHSLIVPPWLCDRNDKLHLESHLNIERIPLHLLYFTGTISVTMINLAQLLFSLVALGVLTALPLIGALVMVRLGYGQQSAWTRSGAVERKCTCDVDPVGCRKIFQKDEGGAAFRLWGRVDERVETCGGGLRARRMTA
jgi:hypothetical protein